MDILPFSQEHLVISLSTILVLGLVVGSFLNVVIYRLPIIMQRQWRAQCLEFLDHEGKLSLTPKFGGEGENAPDEHLTIATPRSRCPHCGHQISALENIPVLSYLALRGRCRHCHARISVRYPCVEILTAIMSMAVVWHFGFSWAAACALVFTWALIVLSIIDLDYQLLPDSITVPLIWLGLTVNLFAVFTDLDASVIGAIAAWTGWHSLPMVILVSALIGAIVGVTLILAKGRDKNIPIPFGPYLSVAGWLSLLWGKQITDFYFSITGLQS